MSFKKQHLWIDRKDKRITLSLPCQVSSMEGRACTGEILNLSAGGLKFSCNRTTFEELLPEGLRIPGMISDVAIRVSFALRHPAAEQPLPVDTTAQIAHSERLAQDSYHVGIQFTGLEDSTAEELKRFISLVLGATENAGG